MRGAPHDVAVEVRPREGERAFVTSAVFELPERGLIDPPELVIDLVKATKRK